MQVNSRKINTYTIAAIGMMSAFAFVSNYISIPIGDITRIHLGNGICALSGLLLGPLAGGFCGGIGAFLYDLTNPLYAAEAPITFLMKFVIGFFAGLIANKAKERSKRSLVNFAAVSVGSLSYVVVYLLKTFIMQYYLLKNPMETVMVKMATKAAASMVNAVNAVIVAMILYPVFVSAMKRSGIMDKIKVTKKEDQKN